MNTIRILLITGEPLLAMCYGEVLAKAGFNVSVVDSGELALERLEETEFAAVVTDVLLPSMSSWHVIAAIRAHAAMGQIPIIVLPSEMEILWQAAEDAGATKQLGRFANPAATLVNALETALAVRATEKSEHPRVSTACLERCNKELSSRLTAVRHALSETSGAEQAGAAFYDVLVAAHHLCEITCLLNWKPMFQITSALESLLLDVVRIPEEATPSTLRSIGQGVDFLVIMAANPEWSRHQAREHCQVLLVEDDANARQLMTAAMQMVTLSATSAATPAIALNLAAKTRFDVIFLDIGLPEMDGFAVCTKIRTIEMHHKTPVVFITGMATFKNRVQSSLSGGNDFIGKPFNLHELGLKALLWVFKGQIAAAGQ